SAERSDEHPDGSDRPIVSPVYSLGERHGQEPWKVGPSRGDRRRRGGRHDGARTIERSTATSGAQCGRSWSGKAIRAEESGQESERANPAQGGSQRGKNCGDPRGGGGGGGSAGDVVKGR